MKRNVRKTFAFCLGMSAIATLGAQTADMTSESSVADVAGMSSDELRKAKEDGIDMTRIPASHGVHIVPLEESPFVGSLAREARKELAEQEKKGAKTARRGEVPYLRNAVQTGATSRSRRSVVGKPYQSVESIRPKLRYEPISVKGTVLEKLRLVEATTGGGLVDGQWTALSRSWEVDGLGYVQLEESEYRETGGSITLIKEWVNADVNGSPASIQTKRERMGKAIVSLDWVTDSTIFRLDLQPLKPNAVKANQEALLALARNLGR